MKPGKRYRGKIMKPCWGFHYIRQKGYTFKGIQLDQYKTLICLFELFPSSKFWCFVLAVAVTTISRHLRSVLLELMFTAGLHVLSDEVAANFDLLHSLHYRSSQNSVFFLSHLNSKCHIELCYLKHAGSNNIGRRQRSIQNSLYGGTTLSPTHCRNLLNPQRPQDCLYIHFFSPRGQSNWPHS